MPPPIQPLPLRPKLLLAFLCLALLGLRCIDVTAPVEFNGAWISSVARNYLRHGLSVGLSPVGDGNLSAGELQFYVHHPPLIGWLVYASALMFGLYEWSARMPVILASLAVMLLIVAIGRRLFSTNTGLLAGALYTFAPFDAFFGRMVLFDLLALAFSLGTYLLYLKWLEKQSFLLQIGMFALAVLGALSDWSYAWTFPLLFADWLLLRNRDPKRERGRGIPGGDDYATGITPGGAARANSSNKAGFILLTILTGFYGLLAAGYILIVHFLIDPLGKSYGGPILGALLARSDTEMGSWSSWGTLLWERLWEMHTPFTAFPALVTLAWAVGITVLALRFRKPINPKALALLIFMVYGLLHSLVFRQAAIVHENWNYMTSVPTVFSAAVGLIAFFEWLANQAHRLIAGELLAAIFLTVSLGELFHLGQTRSGVTDYILGMNITSGVPFEERVAVYEFVRPVVSFYADRALVQEIRNLDALLALREREPSVKWFLCKKSARLPPDLRGYLAENSRQSLQGGFLLFHLDVLPGPREYRPSWLSCLLEDGSFSLDSSANSKEFDLTTLNLPLCNGLEWTAFLKLQDGSRFQRELLNFSITFAEGTTETCTILQGRHLLDGRRTPPQQNFETSFLPETKPYYPEWRGLRFPLRQRAYVYSSRWKFSTPGTPVRLIFSFQVKPGAHYQIGFSRFCFD